MPTFELAWKAFGTLEVRDVDTLEEAIKIAESELSNDSGPIEVNRYHVDGVDVEPT